MHELTQRLADFALDSPMERLAGVPDFGMINRVQLFLKRDDRLHPLVSGNKWRKLKYNLIEAETRGFTTLLTFGGAFSNHLYATAAAGKMFGFRTIGVVRGDELKDQTLNATLSFCRSCGMQLHFVSRADYRRKEEADFIAGLRTEFGEFYLIPEGGTNELAIRGTAEIMPEITAQLGYAPDYVACAVGTGGTVAGLMQSAPPETTVLGFLALKAPNFQLPVHEPLPARHHLITAYHGGGYAKTTPELLDFIRDFERDSGVWIEPVYMGKLLFGLYDLIRKGFFPDGATVVAVHTGGLQGRSGVLA
ncbi:MAG: 1-aminocyclopropane-1-carboxylate deaminase/D-cysteine desulfhydrase [Bacteroidetes bacterium]|nr:1-aminocyclopropane-1-carboxylate deaminase/D-cysteine desulfhydrase [Fibrella sp.]